MLQAGIGREFQGELAGQAEAGWQLCPPRARSGLRPSLDSVVVSSAARNRCWSPGGANDTTSHSSGGAKSKAKVASRAGCLASAVSWVTEGHLLTASSQDGEGELPGLFLGKHTHPLGWPHPRNFKRNYLPRASPAEAVTYGLGLQQRGLRRTRTLSPQPALRLLLLCPSVPLGLRPLPSLVLCVTRSPGRRVFHWAQ